MPGGMMGSGMPGGMMGSGMPGGMMGSGMPGGMMGFGGGVRGGTGYGEGGVEGDFTVPVQFVKATYERTTEDRTGGNQYYIRDLVTKGTIVGANGAAANLDQVYNFKSRYRDVLTSGLVKEYSIARADKPGAYISLPLIELGNGPRRIGSTWSTNAPIMLEWATLDAPPMVNAENTLEGLEWQDGYKTARIKQTYKGKANIPIFGGAGKMNGADVVMTRTIWFGLSVGKVVRMETTTEVKGEAPQDVLSAMVPQAGMSGGGMMSGMGGGAGMMGRAGGMLGGGPTDDGDMGAMGSGGFPGGPGFGGMQMGTEPVLRRAKFKSTTIVSLAKPTKPAKKVAGR
jgi:hypothetical protein